MKKNFYSKIMKTIVTFVTLCFVMSLNAQNQPWELIYKLPATNAFHITNSGNLLLADYRFDMDGGIYVSTDNGNSWEKTAVQDYNYNYFIENENYIFAAGASAYIARSADDGLNWELISYAEAVEDELGWNLPYTVCYAMTFHNGKLFVGDFSGGGIVYSEDEGDTWNKTDIEPLKYVVDGKDCVENIYNLASYNGELYAFGVYFVFRYLPEENSWEVIRDDSNFMAISTIYQNKLCTGRSNMNNSTTIPFISTLDEKGDWGELPRPEGTVDINIRAMYGFGDNLLVGMQISGLYYTSDAGLTWYTVNDGIPYSSGTYFTPMFFGSSDKYVYLAAYEPDYATTQNSGLYRLAKLDLPSYEEPEVFPADVELTAEAVDAHTIKAAAKPNDYTVEYHIGCIAKSELDMIGEDAYAQLLQDDGNPQTGSKEFTYDELVADTEYVVMVTAKNDADEWIVEMSAATTPDGIGFVEIEDANVKVYPNPATSKLFVETNGKACVSIMDMTGRIIKEVEVSDNITTLDIEDVDSGIYFIMIQDMNSCVVEKIVVE